MGKQMIISIGRAFGSGGHEIGKRLATHYGINLYDRNLVELLAQQISEDPEKLEKQEETVIGKMFPGLQKNGFAAQEGGLMTKLSQSDRMFVTERDLIRRLAQTESFVIVGRAANAILEGYPNTLRLYIYASEEFRIQRVKEKYDVDTDQKAKKMMEEIDKKRTEYFQYYSDMIWGSSDGHDASLCSSSFGIDGTVEIIQDMVRRKLGVE